MSVDAEALAGFEETAIARYRRVDCAVFWKTRERWGQYSNMAGGFPLLVGPVRIPSAEALYQACRFPHRPELQAAILAEASPMAAKMRARAHRPASRPDFDRLRVPIMWWSLRVKLACHLPAFSPLLLASADRPIVEQSRRDAFWGAKPTPEDPDVLAGQNVLGRLLGRLRAGVRQHGPEAFRVVRPPALPDFRLCGEPIGTVEGPG